MYLNIMGTTFAVESVFLPDALHAQCTIKTENEELMDHLRMNLGARTPVLYSSDSISFLKMAHIDAVLGPETIAPNTYQIDVDFQDYSNGS